VVKSVQDGVHHHTTGPVEAMPLALQVDGRSNGGSGRPGPREEYGRSRL